MDERESTGLEFGHLGAYRARGFVPTGADLGDAGQVTGLYRELIGRAVGSAGELERLLLDRSELEAAMGQHGSILYIRMTCQTDDAGRAEAYKRYVETIPPAVKPLADELDRKYLRERERFSLDAKRYEVYDRNARADVELFREANVPLQTREELLSQEYQSVCGAMTVMFEGEERTVSQMRKYLEEPDRDRREAAWRASSDLYLRDAGRLDGILDKLLEVRGQIAANAGFENYRDYKFREYHRFDYTPEDCRRFHGAVEKLTVPLLAELYERRREQIGLASLRPWDLQADPLGREGLRPFATIDEYMQRTREVFGRLDPELGGQFGEMMELGLLDLASRKGKAPGGYQDTLAEARKPFIFGNAVGVDSDVDLIMHEGGHAFHALAAADEPLHAYRHAPTEFCEVASMAMELLALPHREVFYDEADAGRSRRTHLESLVSTLVWVALIDAFQFWLYEHPGHSADERAGAWRGLYDRFGGRLVDWSGLERHYDTRWHRQLHIFQFPLYYIEYGIAQLGAMGLWLMSLQDPAGALGRYRAALAMGGSRPLPELFAAAGLEFDFSERTVAPLMEAVRRELEGLEA